VAFMAAVFELPAGQDLRPNKRLKNPSLDISRVSSRDGS